MYQKLINTLTQVDNTWYKCESIHYVCTNHIFDIDTNERLGSPKRNPANEHKRAQPSPNERERKLNKPKRTQTSTNKTKRARAKAKQERGPANEWRRAATSTRASQYNRAGTNEQDKRAGTNGDQQTNGGTSANEHERRPPPPPPPAAAGTGAAGAGGSGSNGDGGSGNNRNGGSGSNRNGGSGSNRDGGSGSNGNGSSVSGSSSSRGLLPHPCSRLSPLFYFIFRSIYMYIIMYFKYFNEKKLINQINKIINK
jgi:hypothetical protein